MSRIYILYCVSLCRFQRLNGLRRRFFENALPAWPISSVGDEIPSSVIDGWRMLGDTCRIPQTTKYFPSKGRWTTDDSKLSDAEKLEKKFDPQSFNCDDGDMTMFNALLCAGGEKSGCAAVKSAQDGSGRFFRSPHRKWVWEVRCYDKSNPSFGDVFRDRCANGFSPDMNLGVLVYTLATRDIGAYKNWLSWLNENAKTTRLCRLDANNQPYDCTNVEWPRVCPVDMGYGEAKIKIDGRQGGLRSLRPQDAFDFGAVNDALGVAMPDAMNTFEVSSRVLVKAAMGAVSKGALSDVPPLLLMSLFESGDVPAFPLHLDEVRVLIRMMIRNPSMQLNNLPDLPTPDDFVKQVTQVGSPDGTDVASIALAAKAIAQRAPWNPFYRLLSEGPTDAVRSLITEHCPMPGWSSARDAWLWEVPSAEALSSKSMGWDCVFVAELYNKMRVKRDILDELMDWALKLGDGLGTSLTVASRGALCKTL